MTLARQAHLQTAIVAMVVAGLGFANWYQTPSNALVWFAGITTMAMIVVVVLLRAGRPSQSEADIRFLALCAVLAGALLAVPLGVALVRSSGLSDPTWLDRAPGIAMGLVLLFVGNALPKVFGRPHPRATVQERSQAARRLTGWVFALAGAAGVATWVFAPVAHAEVISTLIYAGGLVATLTGWVWFARRPGRTG